MKKTLMLAMAACLALGAGAQRSLTSSLPAKGAEFVTVADSTVMVDEYIHSNPAEAYTYRCVLTADIPAEGHEALRDTILSYTSLKPCCQGKYRVDVDALNARLGTVEQLTDAGAELLGVITGMEEDSARSPMQDGTYNVQTQVQRNTPEYIGLLSNMEYYGGGAHGMYSVTSINYNPKTGEFLTLKDVIPYVDQQTPAEKKRYQALCDKLTAAFVKWMDLPAGENPGDYGCVPVVEPAPDFLLGDGKITFYYQPYTLGPWAIGMPVLTLPLTDL